MKKLISLLSAFMLVFTMALPVYAAGTVTFSIGDATLQVGKGTQKVEIPIVLSGNQNGVCGIYLKLTYDNAIKMVSVRQGETLRTLVYTAPDDLTKMPFNLVWDGLHAETGDGNILYMTFEVPTDHAADYSIRFLTTGANVYDDDLEDYQLKLNDGTIHVKGEGSSQTDNNPGGDNNGNGQEANSGNTGNDSDPVKSEPSNVPQNGDGSGTETGNGKGEPAVNNGSQNFPGFYYIVITMTDAGAAEECRVEYYPTGNAADTPAEQQIDLSNITNATIKILDSAKEGAADPKALCYVVTDEQGHVNIKATNQLNGVE